MKAALILFLLLLCVGCDGMDSRFQLKTAPDTPAIARLRAVATSHHLHWEVNQDNGSGSKGCRWHVRVWKKDILDRWFEIGDAETSPDAAIEAMIVRIDAGLKDPPDLCGSCKNSEGEAPTVCKKHDSRKWSD